MNDAAAILVAVAVGIVSNFISFFALQQFDRRRDATPITIETESVRVRRTQIRGIFSFEIVERQIVIRKTVFIQHTRTRTRLNLLVSAGVALASFAIVGWALLS